MTHSFPTRRASELCVPMMERADNDRAFWDDGEWVSWDEINQQIEYKEWRAKYPNADISLVPIFESLLSTACSYNAHTGKHLHVYGDIGELYGAITHGIRLNRNYAQDRKSKRLKSSH